MSQEETPFEVMLTKEQIQSLINALWFHENETNEHIDDGVEDLIERLERRLRQITSEEAEMRGLADRPEYLVGI
jgi:hypothetical protein